MTGFHRTAAALLLALGLLVGAAATARTPSLDVGACGQAWALENTLAGTGQRTAILIQRGVDMAIEYSDGQFWILVLMRPTLSCVVARGVTT